MNEVNRYTRAAGDYKYIESEGHVVDLQTGTVVFKGTTQAAADEYIKYHNEGHAKQLAILEDQVTNLVIGMLYKHTTPWVCIGTDKGVEVVDSASVFILRFDSEDAASDIVRRADELDRKHYSTRMRTDQSYMVE